VCGLHSILHTILATGLASPSGTIWHYLNSPQSLAALLRVRASGAQRSQSILAGPTFPSGQSSELWKASGPPKRIRPDYARRQRRSGPSGVEEKAKTTYYPWFEAFGLYQESVALPPELRLPERFVFPQAYCYRMLGVRKAIRPRGTGADCLLENRSSAVYHVGSLPLGAVAGCSPGRVILCSLRRSRACLAFRVATC
jgi:hypothetical protein